MGVVSTFMQFPTPRMPDDLRMLILRRILETVSRAFLDARIRVLQSGPDPVTRNYYVDFVLGLPGSVGPKAIFGLQRLLQEMTSPSHGWMHYSDAETGGWLTLAYCTKELEEFFSHIAHNGYNDLDITSVLPVLDTWLRSGRGV